MPGVLHAIYYLHETISSVNSENEEVNSRLLNIEQLHRKIVELQPKQSSPLFCIFNNSIKNAKVLGNK